MLMEFGVPPTQALLVVFHGVVWNWRRIRLLSVNDLQAYNIWRGGGGMVEEYVFQLLLNYYIFEMLTKFVFFFFQSKFVFVYF